MVSTARSTQENSKGNGSPFRIVLSTTIGTRIIAGQLLNGVHLVFGHFQKDFVARAIVLRRRGLATTTS